MDEHSEVSNSIDRTNKCASDGERMTGKLWQLTRGLLVIITCADLVLYCSNLLIFHFCVVVLPSM